MKYSFPSEHLKLDVLALILVVCITIFNATLSCAIHLKTGNDTLASYKAVHSFKQGAAFNHIRAPDPNDLSKNSQYQLTWWTPGQYVLPWSIKTITQLPIHTSEWITVILSLISFTFGIYFLIRQLGFSKAITHWSLALILSSQAILFRLHIYDGGTTLLDAVWPWAALIILKRRLSFLSGISFTLLCLIGFFMKSSFLVIFVGLSLFFLIKTIHWPLPDYRIRSASRPSLKSLRLLLGYLLCSIVFLSLVLSLHTSQGDGPNSVSRQTANTYPDTYDAVKASLYPIAAPLDYISQPIPYLIRKHTQMRKGIIQIAPTIWLVITAAISTFIIASSLYLSFLPAHYRQFILAFVITYFLLFWYFYHSQVPISLDSRHFYPLAFVLIPAFVSIIKAQPNKKLVTGITLFFLLLASTNEALFVKHRFTSVPHRKLIDGYLYPKSIAESVRAIKTLDKNYSGEAVFYITPWNRFLEFAVTKNKIYPLGLGGTGIPRYRKTPYFNSDASHFGRANPLIVLTAYNFEIPVNWFPDYTEFRLIGQTSTHLIWIGD